MFIISHHPKAYAIWKSQRKSQRRSPCHRIPPHLSPLSKKNSHRKPKRRQKICKKKKTPWRFSLKNVTDGSPLIRNPIIRNPRIRHQRICIKKKEGGRRAGVDKRNANESVICQAISSSRISQSHNLAISQSATISHMTARSCLAHHGASHRMRCDGRGT